MTILCCDCGDCVKTRIFEEPPLFRAGNVSCVESAALMLPGTRLIANSSDPQAGLEARPGSAAGLTRASQLPPLRRRWNGCRPASQKAAKVRRAAQHLAERRGSGGA